MSINLKNVTIKVISSIRGCRDLIKRAIFTFQVGQQAFVYPVEPDCCIRSGSLAKFSTWLLSVLVFRADKAGNGKIIRNVVKLPVSGCKISVRNKFPIHLPFLFASVAKNFFLRSIRQVSSMPTSWNHRKTYMPHSSVLFNSCEWDKRHVTWESSNRHKRWCMKMGLSQMSQT